MLASPLPTVLASPLGLHGRHAFVQGVEPGLGGDVALGAVAQGRAVTASCCSWPGSISRCSG